MAIDTFARRHSLIRGTVPVSTDGIDIPDQFHLLGLYAFGVGGLPAAPTISINQGASLNLHVDTTAQLSVTATGEPTPTITWGSDDELVATVDENGLVTAIGLGSAVITATATNTEGNDTDTITVNVVEVVDGGMMTLVGLTQLTLVVR